MKRTILIISRLLLGSVFVFSGFVKAIDPLGFTYKIEDYLTAMGPFMEQFSGLAFIASVLLSAVELVVGLNLVLGIRLRESNFGAALLMLFMTPLTLWIALTNPVTDCGCFGDALVIDNWTTFWKNTVLCALIIVIFLLRKEHRPFVRNRAQWIIAVYGFVFAIVLSIYCYRHLPLIDFRPYKIEANILEGMSVPENAPMDSFDIKLIYTKDGVEKEFALENYPASDSTWTFVDQKTTLIKKGYEPPIHDFTITIDGEDITQDMLANEGYTFLLIAYDLNKANLAQAEKFNNIYRYAQQNGYDFYALTASLASDIENYRKASGAEYPFGFTDKITLKTIIRSNPGLMLIKNATVIGKWHHNDLPEFRQPLENSYLGKAELPDTKGRILIVALLFFIPVLLIAGVDRFLKIKKEK
ncbi:MAG: DoxX family protein [Prevotellaceae bacterium]|jgi:uncharacterized membrane protein YphA (DoxX/SURF4 family)|nr:DoxX family protein [Prevotellaceae bacterium]